MGFIFRALFVVPVLLLAKMKSFFYCPKTKLKVAAVAQIGAAAATKYCYYFNSLF